MNLGTFGLGIGMFLVVAVIAKLICFFMITLTSESKIFKHRY